VLHREAKALKKINNCNSYNLAQIISEDINNNDLPSESCGAPNAGVGDEGTT
jgi:hypothetical protein